MSFDDGFGGVEGPAVVVHTPEWVYFSVCYDGSEWVGKVPRHPNPEWKPHHYGGG